MAVPITAPLPGGIELQGGYVLQLAAVSPVDGSAVSGVKVSGFVVTGTDLTGGLAPGEEPTVTALEPLFVPIPTEAP